MDRANVVTLFQRRNSICARCFDRIHSDTSHKLHGLIPPRHETPYHLRKNNCLEIPIYETNRFLNSFIIAASKRHNVITLPQRHFVDSHRRGHDGDKKNVVTSFIKHNFKS